MNFRIMFLLNALIAVVLGLAFLAAPGRVLGQFGVDEYAATKLITQFFGTALLALGLLLWFAKEVREANLQKGMGVALLAGAAAGVFISVSGILAGVVRSNGWIAVIVNVVLGLAYAYLGFLRPRAETY